MRRFGRGWLILAALFPLLDASRSAALLWPSETERVMRDLGAADVAVRRRAAQRIRELPSSAAARAVRTSLEDDDIEVRLTAVETAKALRVTGLAERVIGWLTEADPRLRLAAAEMLAAEPTPRAVGPLSRALSDVEPQVRAAAAAALGASGAPEAVIGLLGRLDDSAVEVKESVIRALARLGDSRAVVPLVSKIEDSRPVIRRAVARALGDLGDRRAVSALVLALRDSDSSVRGRAIEALGEIGDASVVPSISAVLSEDSASDVRLAAIDALGRLATPEATARLIDAFGRLTDERDALVQALSRVGKEAVPALSHCLTSSESRERADGCALALAHVATSDGAALILDAVRRGRVSPDAALVSLGEIGDPVALPLALEFLGHRDPAVRRAALSAARALLHPADADGRAVEPLELAFHRAKGRRSERLALLELLGRTGSPRAARVLVPIADEATDIEFRLAALAALGNVRESSVPAALLRALDDPEPSVRLAAALSIRKSAPRGQAQALLERLERASAQDRSALALALAGAIHAAPNALVARAARAALAADGPERDALIEALLHTRAPAARATIRTLASSVDPADRAKVAEGLGADAQDVATLVALASDPDPAVRANALWSLGAAGTARERGVLVKALADRDVAVAANAAAALGRLSRRAGAFAARELCAALGDGRAVVRAASLAALRLGQARCEGRARKLLSEDPSARVRAAAAELVRDVTPDAADRRALRRCAAQEPTGSVAAACAALPSKPLRGESEVVAFVVPAGETAPVARAPFALRRPDGLVRHGVADRRGAVCERGVPDGELALEVPAALEE